MINKEIHDKLREEFNPDNSSIRKLQLRALDILVEIDRICTKHNITYILSSGTLLGAVRHGGFIPWDDDLDIEMTMKNFKKLIKVLPVELSDEYQLQTHKTDIFYYFAFAKIRDKRTEIIEKHPLSKYYQMNGVFIDIFPIEYRNDSFHKISNRNIKNFIISPIKHMKNPEKYLKCMWFFIENILFPIYKFISLFCPKSFGNPLGYSYTDTRIKKHLESTMKINFEGKMFNSPVDYDEYLKHLYGDYMEIPENKVTHGVSVVFKE